jgi:hypothetical protein
MPIFSFEWEENEAEGRATGIQTWEERYDILFSKEKIQELYDSGMITAMTQFSIETGSRNYGGFSYEVFMERDFDDLVYFGQNGKFPTAEEKAILTAPPSKRMGIKNA